jgi:hypothetical protein
MLFYIIVKKITDVPTALLSALLLAISPWHIIASRATQEVIMSAVFTLAALLSLLHLTEKKFSDIKLSAVFLIFSFLSMYSYHSAKLFLPIMIFSYLAFVFFQKQAEQKKLIILSACFIVILAVSFVISGLTRFGSIGIFSTPETQLLINEKNLTLADNAPGPLIRIFNNKIVDYSYTIASNYFEHYSPGFLFFKGGQPTRNLVPFQGLLFPFEILFLIIGVAWVLVRENRKPIIFILMAVLAPIPAALTFSEIPSTIRSFPLVFPLVFFVAFGLIVFFRLKFKVAPVKFLVILLYSFSSLLFLFNLFVSQPNYHPWNRNYADNLLPDEVKKRIDSYNEVFISSKPYDYFILAGMITPQQMQDSYPERLGRLFKVGKITFSAEPCVIPQKEKTIYFIADECSISRYSTNKLVANQVGKITYKDGVTAYKIVELHKEQ